MVIDESESRRWAQRQEYPVYTPPWIPPYFPIGGEALSRAYAQEEEENKLSKLTESTAKQDPAHGLQSVYHDLNFGFRNFSPENLVEVKNLYGIPQDAAYYFYTEDVEIKPQDSEGDIEIVSMHYINITWHEKL